MQGWVLRAGGCPRDSRGVFLPRFFLRWGRKKRAPGGRQVICLVDIACRKLQVCFLKPGVVEYCVENLLLLCINPSTLYGFDLANRALRSWSLTQVTASPCQLPLLCVGSTTLYKLEEKNRHAV